MLCADNVITSHDALVMTEEPGKYKCQIFGSREGTACFDLDYTVHLL